MPSEPPENNKFEQVKLPWKKTSTITLSTDAERRIGLPVSVTPGEHRPGCSAGALLTVSESDRSGEP
ncbi:hypothetical protein AB0A98_22450 [Streptomyces chrestomyceticus]|uniref:hypothetical protein n=1 Tax=Streptomyces chrestomyceticus TaxID=68185 RepID=UPI0033C13BC9